MNFLEAWGESAYTSVGFFWMALWAFALGYLISSLIQTGITRAQMQRTMGSDGPRAMALGTFFGFISSSCSFAALSMTRALFQKGAGLAPSMAFMLASTNLVIELGIVIALFLSWQFVVGEYVGGLLLIGFCWLFIRITRPKQLIETVRQGFENERGSASERDASWRKALGTVAGWRTIGQTYVMEWKMVWKDVLIGFTVAGVIAAFVPDAFFQTLFIGSGESGQPGFGATLLQTIVGPVAAFFTFIGSMGNIPLAALLFGQGVTFAGVMAFIFSDLVVWPVLRINAEYYGWKLALFILAMLLCGLVLVSLLMHYCLLAFGLLPEPGSVNVVDREFFELNYGFFLNMLFLAGSAALAWLWWLGRDTSSNTDKEPSSRSTADLLSLVLVAISVCWLIGGLAVHGVLQ